MASTLKIGDKVMTFHGESDVTGKVTGRGRYGDSYTVRIDGEDIDREFHASVLAKYHGR